MLRFAQTGTTPHGEVQNPGDNPMPGEEEQSQSVEWLRERVAELEAENRRWMHLAGTNRLTNLPNSLMLYQVVLPSEIRKAGAAGSAIACALISPDGLGEINQVFGRSIGDQLIVEFSSFLKQRTSDDERLFHSDGANFVILMTDAAEGRARRKATEIRAEVKEATFKTGDRDFDELSCSAGVATIDGVVPQETIAQVVDGLYHDLSDRLYRAKQRGGNTVIGSSRKEV
jgi:diguanylate cyclase (GGDEF)-like protein